mgnify:CR=1 FL=1
MKIKKIGIIVSIIAIIVLGTGFFLISKYNRTNSTSSEPVKDEIVEKIKNETATNKEIEDWFLKDKQNEEKRSVYYYNCAKFYEKSKVEEKIKGMSNLEKEKYYLMRISPEYNGILSEKIANFGIQLFGNKEEWQKEYEIGEKINERQKKIYEGDYSEAKEIYNYIKNKYDEYSKENGKEADDEYSSNLFKEVSDKYGVTILEANDIWENLIMDVEKYAQPSNKTSSYNNTSYNSSINTSSYNTKSNSTSTEKKHYCQASGCYSEGTYTIKGIGGKTEYYCYKHYKQMMDFAEKLMEY